jgi:hypothetical protein
MTGTLVLVVLGPCFMTITKDEGGWVSNRITLAVESRALGALAPRRNGEKGFRSKFVACVFPAVLFRLVLLGRLGLCAAPAGPSCLTAPRSFKAASGPACATP